MNRRQFITSSAGALAAPLFPAAAADVKKKTVWGIAELWQWLYEKQQTSGHDSADCLQAHLDHGIHHVMWALGRSTLDYQSALPTSTMYAGDTRPETKVIGDSFRQECSLRAALAFAEKNDMVIYGRLGMNRHYGDSLGGGLRSKYIAEHPEWMERHRGGQVDSTKVSFAIPEYRAERIAVLLEVAQIGAHGLCLDFCRELEKTTKRKVPVMVRIPEATLDLNLMEGLDLRTWLKEGCVDEIALDPLWIWDFDYPDTASPYVELARAHGVKIHGGANTVTGKGVTANARGFLERIARNYDEGVNGIALFQTDAAALDPSLKALLGPLFPHLADAATVSEKLSAARIKQPQMSEGERHFGLDNHSLLPQLGRAPRLSFDTL